VSATSAWFVTLETRRVAQRRGAEPISGRSPRSLEPSSGLDLSGSPKLVEVEDLVALAEKKLRRDLAGEFQQLMS